MSRLVLLTNTFPWGKGETFIDNEIKFYDMFDSVVIIAHDNDSYRRITQLSSNIHCLQLPKLRIKYKLYWFLSALFTYEFYEELRHIKGGKTLSKIYALIAFIGKGKRIANFYLKKVDCDKEEPTVFYSYWLHHNAYAAVKLARLFKHSKTVSRCHRYDLYVEQSYLQYLPLRHFLRKNLLAIYSISIDGMEYLKRLTPDLRNENIKLARLGTPDYGFDYHSLKPGVLRIVSCSWISRVKRVHRIAEVLCLIPAEYSIIWTHIGCGEADERLNTAIKSLPPNITVDMKGAMSNQDIHTFYQTNPQDVFINVSESEGVPVSIMEAMSHGIPVIATDVGGTKEIVENDVNGFLLPVDFKNEDLQSLLNTFLNMNEATYSLLQRGSRKVWSDKFDAASNYNDFITELKHL